MNISLGEILISTNNLNLTFLKVYKISSISNFYKNFISQVLEKDNLYMLFEIYREPLNVWG
jgi:hypothetical protein